MRKFFLLLVVALLFFVSIFCFYGTNIFSTNSLNSTNSPDFMGLRNLVNFFKNKETTLTNIQNSHYAQTTHDAQTIAKRPLDNKTYKFIQLENGLKILLIHDEKAKLAAASLSVGSGSANEPSSIHGLAHYLEHMLFLGSEKYPKADNFMEFVSQNGGSYNAYTASDETNFFFSINPIALYEALARFSDFFAAPLLTEEFMQREQQAVHAEYTSKLQDNGRRNLDALRETFNPANPISRFSAGNKETLAITPELRPALVDFFKTNYFASNMALVILTPESLQTTQTMLEKHFDKIQDGKKVELVDVDIFADDFLPAKLEIKPLGENYNLHLYFPTLNPEKYYRQKPDYYLTHLIGYEGEGSILSVLKDLGWALSLGAGNSFTYKDKALFTIQIKLTPDGFKNIDKIKQLIFNYLDLIAKDGISQWRFDELQAIFASYWNYKEGENPLDLVMNLASDLKKVAPQDILKSSYVFEDYDAKLIADFLANLTPNNMLEVVIAPSLTTDKETNWLHTPYKITSFAKSLDLKEQTKSQSETGQNSQKNAQTQEITNENETTEENQALSANLFLPEKNIFLAEQKMLTQRVQAPLEFLNSENLQIFVGEDASFKTPKIFYKFNFESKLANKNAKAFVMNALLAKWLRDKTTSLTYPAYLADLETRIGATPKGLILELNGLSAKAGELLSIVLQELKQGDISPAKFAIFKADILRELANKKYRALTQQMFEKFHGQIIPPSFSDADLIDNLRKLQIADFEKFRREFLLSSKIIAFLYGNVDASASADIQERLQNFIHLGTKAQLITEKTNFLQAGEVFGIDLKIENPDKGFLYYIQAPDASIENRAKFALLTKMQDAEFFYQLRTLQQLGYVVANVNQPMPNVAGNVFLVQSPTSELENIYKSLQEFLQKDADRLKSMSQEDFSAFKAGLINLLEKPDDSLKRKAQRFWDKIFNKQTPVDDRAEIIMALKAISLQDMNDFYADILAHKYGELVFTAGAKGLKLNKPIFQNK